MKDLKLKQRFATIAIALVAAAIVGVVVMVSGVVPISADSGHWAVTKWILDFSKRRSISLHSTGIDAPPLDDESLVMKGAGHFESSCVQCHGSPSRPPSPIAVAMTATPPALPSKINNREVEELFYVLDHGIKFTGMPAWPAENRDDEIWAMVAFLRELPEMNEQRYRELAGLSVIGHSQPQVEGVAPATLQTCIRCHGSDGRGRGTGAFPVLAGQNKAYLSATLHAYAKDQRHSGIMHPVAAILSTEELNALAEHFAELSSDETDGSESQTANAAASQNVTKASFSADAERGKMIAHDGIPEKNVPSCIDCHGPPSVYLSPDYPILARQPAEYLVLQLKLFKEGNRGGTSVAHLMKPVVRNLSKEDMRDVAAYYSSLSSER